MLLASLLLAAPGAATAPPVDVVAGVRLGDGEAAAARRIRRFGPVDRQVGDGGAVSLTAGDAAATICRDQVVSVVLVIGRSLPRLRSRRPVPPQEPWAGPVAGNLRPPPSPIGGGQGRRHRHRQAEMGEGPGFFSCLFRGGGHAPRLRRPQRAQPLHRCRRRAPAAGLSDSVAGERPHHLIGAAAPLPDVLLLFPISAGDNSIASRWVKASAKELAMKLAFFGTVAFLAIAAAAASAAVAAHPRLLKRHGVVIGVRIDDSSCKGFEALDMCETYTLSGTIISVDHNAETHRIDNFVLRTAGGRTKMQNFENYMPRAVEALVRCGRHVRVSGVMTGMGRVAFPGRVVVWGRTHGTC